MCLPGVCRQYDERAEGGDSGERFHLLAQRRCEDCFLPSLMIVETDAMRLSLSMRPEYFLMRDIVGPPNRAAR